MCSVNKTHREEDSTLTLANRNEGSHTAETGVDGLIGFALQRHFGVGSGVLRVGIDVMRGS